MVIPGISTSSVMVVLLGGAAALGLGAQNRVPSKQDADRLALKIARIQAVGHTPVDGPRASVRTVFSESEVNAYLFWNQEDVLPPGVTEPRMRLAGDGAVSAEAVVDLTAIRNQRPRGWFDPLAYVGGRVPVTASGVIRARDGTATLDLTGATIAGVAVPKPVLQELVSYYTRSARFPEGVSLDDPFPLPAAIREVLVGKGEAVVIQ